MTFRYQLLLGGLLLTTHASGQSLSAETPAPTRWNAPPATISVQPPGSVGDPTLVDRTRFPDLQLAAVNDGEPVPEPAQRSFASPTITVTSSLAIVLGLFAALVWITRKFGNRSMNRGIPDGVLQSLGSMALDPRTRLTMLRCGNRILVVAQTNSGIHPLSEITDADEVRQMTAACLGESHRNFASALKSLEQEPAPAGFTGEKTTSRNAPPSAEPRSPSRLFVTA